MMKTARIVVVLALAGALCLPAAANVRMARKADGTFSGALKAAAPAAALRLIAERLDAILPEFVLGSPDPKSLVRFRIVYEIENRGTGPVLVPLRFIAVDIRDLTAELDGRALAVEMREAPGEKEECLVRIARHRSGFLPGFYEDFLRRLRADAGLDKESGDGWLQKLEGRDLSGKPAFSSFLRTLESPPEKDFPSAEFEILLPPGRSRLVVTYGQRLFIDERNNGYFAAWPRKGVTGFDYLLYPAKTWDMDSGFRLNISVTVPDAQGKVLFFKTWKRPEIKCSLPLREETSGTRRIRVFRGEFDSMPADVLTFLFWFDKDAGSYLR